MIEVNPRASRTVPFVSKSIGLPLAKIANQDHGGKTLGRARPQREIVPQHFAVKESVFPFVKFPGVDTILGPEMRSTGEVMGLGESFAEAFGKAMVASGFRLPPNGTVFVSVRDRDKTGSRRSRVAAHASRLFDRRHARHGEGARARRYRG